MKKAYILLASILMVTATAEAQWGKKVKGKGKEVTETREVGDYDEIQVSHIFKVEIVPGSEGTLTLEGEENLLDYVITDVSGGRLKITVERGIQLQPSRDSEGIRIQVPVEDLDEVSVSGAADLMSEHTFDFSRLRVKCSGAGEVEMAVRAEEVRVSASGAAKIRLEGSTDRLDVEGSGAANLRAYELQANEVNAEVSGASDVRVYAAEALDARASGAGNIRYKGNPERLEKQASRAANVSKS